LRDPTKVRATNRYQCRAKQREDQRKSEEERAAERAWMKDFLARERQQIQAEEAQRARRHEEMQLWAESLKQASRSEALVRASILRCRLHFPAAVHL
jgi:hypothetical protein